MVINIYYKSMSNSMQAKRYSLILGSMYAYKFGPLSGSQQNAILMVFRWRADSGPIFMLASFPGGGGGYSNFFFIRRLRPSIDYLQKKKIRNFKHPKKYLKFYQLQKISPILYLDHKKRP